MGSGFVAVYMRAIPARESFPISRKWLALREASLQGQQGTQMSEHQKIKDVVNAKSKKTSPAVGGVDGHRSCDQHTAMGDPGHARNRVTATTVKINDLRKN